MTKKTIFDTYAVNVDLENEGVWVSLSMSDDIQVHVRSAQCRKFKRALHTANQRHAKILDKKKKSFEEEESIALTLAKTAVSHLLIGWKGFIGEDGKEIKFSTEKAKEILLDPRMRNLLDEVVEIATTPETYQTVEELEAPAAIEGN